MRRWSVGALLVVVLLSASRSRPAGWTFEQGPARQAGPTGEMLLRSDLVADDLAPFDNMMSRFLIDNEVPGAALAVAKEGRLIYARGFGYADSAANTLMTPRALFRIASISKPITAAAILRLVEMGKLKLDEPAFALLKLAPPDGIEPDPRLKRITIRQLLQHTAGFDRAQSFDPMFRPIAIAKSLHTAPPARPTEIIRYMMGRRLDFDPGSRYAYSNFGYCVLGRVIEAVSGKRYEAFVKAAILDPLHMTDTRLGKTLEPAPGEVHYVDLKNRTARAVVGAERGKPVPLAYGSWYLEAMDAHGGWLSTAPDLVRFAAAFDRPERCPILTADSVRTLFARPAGAAGQANKDADRNVYYGCGWQVRIVDEKKGTMNAWHNGRLDGTATLLVRSSNGLCWAVLFNASENRRAEYLGKLIDPLLHQAAARVKRWPTGDLFRAPPGKRGV